MMGLLLFALLLAPIDSDPLVAGKKAFDQGRYEEAIRLWKDARAKTCEAPFYIGLAHFRLQRLNDALIHFRESIACNPQNVLARVALAEATVATGDQNRALSIYEEALKIDPNSQEALAGAASIAIANQLNDKAAVLLSKLIELKPDDSQIHAQLGAVYAATSRVEAAEQEFQSALKLNPENQSARVGLANIYIKREKIEQAIELLEKTSALGSSYEAPFLLGSAYSKLGRFEQAVAAFKAALRFDSEQAEVHYQMAMALAKLDRIAERDEALKRFRELKDRMQSKAEEVRQAARLIEEAKPYVDRGELGQALELLRKANSAHPNSADILFRIAGLEYDLRRLEAARATVTRAIRLRSDEWNYYFLLGLIEKDASRFRESREALEIALRLNAESAEVHNQLGSIAMAQGLMKEAIESFRNAVRLGPDDPAFRANLKAAQASGHN